MHNKDTKFTKEFVAILEQRGVRTNSLPKANPNMNGKCERMIGTLKWECLSTFILSGKRHLDLLVSGFTENYNQHRSLLERDRLPPIRQVPEDVETLKLDQVEV